MRLKNLVLWDMRLQAKYGFYFLYAVLTALYLIVLLALPPAWREKAAAILIFSDPAAMVVLEEIDDHIAGYLFVTALGRRGYFVSRLCVPAGAAFLFTALLLQGLKLTEQPLQRLCSLRRRGRCRASWWRC